MRGVASDRGCRPATPAPLLWRQRLHAGRPQAGGGLDADDIGKTDLGDAVAQIGVVAVSRIEQCDFGLNPGREGGTKLVKCDLWLGLEDDIVGHACLSAPSGIINPLVWQIQAIGDWQTGVIVRGR